ncbi:MAG: DUF1947 domain-containing protein [Candidatus Bathyarchaeia archaeon]
MSKGRKRHFLKEKEAKALLEKVSERLKVNLKELFGSGLRVELVETDFGEVFIINGKPALFKAGGILYPTLLFEEVFAYIPRIVVDMGAVSHICNGANVMAPGVVRFEGGFKKGDVAVVLDEKYGKPLMVGEMLHDEGEAIKVKRGAVVKNVHYVGDKIWKCVKELV